MNSRHIFFASLATAAIFVYSPRPAPMTGGQERPASNNYFLNPVQCSMNMLMVFGLYMYRKRKNSYKELIYVISSWDHYIHSMLMIYYTVQYTGIYVINEAKMCILYTHTQASITVCVQHLQAVYK